MEVSELAEILRLKAFRWAIGSTAGLSSEFKVRIAVVASIVATSEYGNQLKVRADALMKQFARETGRDRRELPPAVALREAEPTDFTRLYKWFDAATYNWVAKHIEGIGSVEDRVNVVERLFGDNFWARINTVYASGRGEARMAFVKDDVGNWNLKSFDNDPEELLKAYTRFTKVALQKAAEITAAAATGGSSQAAAALVNQMSSVNQLMSLANQSGLPGGREARAAPVAEVVAGLHERVADKLHKRAQRCAAEEKSIPDEDGNATAEKKVTQRLKCLEALGEILRSHSEVLDTTVKSLLPTSQTNPPDVETLKAASVPPKSP